MTLSPKREPFFWEAPRPNDRSGKTSNSATGARNPQFVDKDGQPIVLDRPEEEFLRHRSFHSHHSYFPFFRSFFFALWNSSLFRLRRHHYYLRRSGSFDPTLPLSVLVYHLADSIALLQRYRVREQKLRIGASGI